MKLNNKLMFKLLKEEYDKRINYYLGEVETRASYSKEDGELVQNAHGLKVKDRAGNVFVIDKIVYSDNQEVLVHLITPGQKDPGIKLGDSTLSLNDYKNDDINIDDETYLNSSIQENEDNSDITKNSKNVENKNPEPLKDKKGEIISPNPKAKSKKSFKIDIDSVKDSEYEEANGRIIITLKELEEEFTL